MKVCKTQNNKNIKHQNNGTINNTINIVGFGKERHEYLRSQCKDHIKMDLYNNRERIDDENPKGEEDIES